MEMRRIPVVLVLLLAATVWPVTSGLAHRPPTTHAAADGSLQADFDNDGFPDLAIGVIGEDAGTEGAVNVLYGSSTGPTGVGGQFFTQDSPRVPGAAEPDDSFGAALAVGDFDRDGFADLAIGVPHEDVGTIADAGAVNVLYGSIGGLTGTGSQIFTQNSPGVGSAAEEFDSFGHALAAGDFDSEGFADLAIGAPGEDIGTLDFGGAVNILPGSTGGLTGLGSQLFTQNSPGVPGGAEPGDNLGLALASEDFNSDSFADLAIGSAEDVGTLEDAGAVNVLPGSASGLTGTGSQSFTQNSPGVPGDPQENDGFGGRALAAGDFDSDSFADLAIGVLEDVDTISGAGTVNILPGSAGGLTGTGSQLFTQDTPEVPDSAELLDQFGAALAAGDFDSDSFADLAVGVLGEDVDAFQDAGAVNMLPGSAGGLTGTGSQLFTQNSPGVRDSVEFDDFFGNALAASGPSD
jgi:FG-GAP repeat